MALRAFGVDFGVEAAALTDVRQVASGSAHALVLLNSGVVHSFGSNSTGQIGRPDNQSTCLPINASVVQVACGDIHSVAVTKCGKIFVWGSNHCGQLGLPFSYGVQKSITAPLELSLREVCQAVCGANHTVALFLDGSVFCWGQGTSGQLGFGSFINVPSPERLRSLSGVPLRKLAGGGQFTVALSVSGAVFAWGDNSSGQLGCGDTRDRCYPTHLRSLRYQKIVDIVCGWSHVDGGLFTFGSDAFGQSAHGKGTDEAQPKRIFDLMGSKVMRVAAGRGHTVAVVEPNRVIAFGANANGQLGLQDNGDRRAPTDVACIDHSPLVFAGGDQTFLLPRLDGAELSAERPTQAICHIEPTAFMHLVRQQDSGALLALLESVFSSVACVNASFLKPGLGHAGANKNNCGVDMDALRECCMALADHRSAAQINDVMFHAIRWSLLAELSPSPPDMEALRVYIILPWCPVFSDASKFELLQSPFAEALLSLAELPATVISSWWSAFEPRHFRRLLLVFKGVVEKVVSSPPSVSADSSAVLDAARREKTLVSSLRLMERLYKLNVSVSKVPLDFFYVADLASKIDLQNSYLRWVMNKDEKRPFSFCDYPFVFNAKAKTMLVQTDARLQMHLHVEEAARWNVQAMFLPMVHEVSPFLHLTVNRDRIVDDTVSQLLSTRTDYLTKPLKVQFAGEEADDAGGVKKEFFMLLFQALLHPQYGMFTENEESRLLWFSSYAFAEPETFQLVGLLCGLALHNMVLVDFHFPLVLYKKLLGHAVCLDDLKELSPTEARGLEQLVEYADDDFEDVFMLTFEVSASVFDATTRTELKEGGAQTAVTKENRQEYVELYVEHRLSVAVRRQFDAFSDGFHRVVNSRILRFFQPLELMEMVIGNEHYDWDQFKRSTLYKGDYWLGHPVVDAFWRAFAELTSEQKKKFLLFLTGSDRVPLLGMGELKMAVQPADAAAWPVAHTCFNLLDLPRVADAAVLRERLLLAIEHNRGFTLV